MRLIGSLPNEFLARRFSLYLEHRGIAHSYDSVWDSTAEHAVYQIWIHDEDQIALASTLWEQFEKNSLDPIFQVQPKPVQKPLLQRRDFSFLSSLRTPCTFLILVLCILVFLFEAQEVFQREKGGQNLELTTMESWLLFDTPLDVHGQPTLWHGISSWILLKLATGSGVLAEGPFLVKIRQGEIWRLFTPALLHRDFLHILFNMIWLWMLSRPIEERIGPWKTLFFVLTVGIISNMAQYLMGGPFFLGYSGVITGMAGFIWMRRKKAPWEGYPIPLTTLYFLGFFVLAMSALQGVSLLLRLFTSIQVSPHIANTAHITGALVGILLGKSSFFSWRSR